MSSSIRDRTWKIYALAIVFLTPAFITWLLADIFLSPTLEKIRERANLRGSDPQWLMSSADFFILHGRLIIPAIILILLFLEYRVLAWPRYRLITVMTVVFIFNASVFAGMAVFSTSAIMAAKILFNRL